MVEKENDVRQRLGVRLPGGPGRPAELDPADTEDAMATTAMATTTMATREGTH
jgi:hypothetical protein